MLTNLNIFFFFILKKSRERLRAHPLRDRVPLFSSSFTTDDDEKSDQLHFFAFMCNCP